MGRKTTIASLVLLAACSGSGDGTVESVSSTVPTTSTTTLRPTTSTTLSFFDADEVPTLALYLAAIEQGLEGTGMEGAAFEEAESLINTGVLFCELLEQGFGPVDVLRGWVAALSVDGATPTEDDLFLGGVVLGAAVKLICPEFLADLEL
ncbi:MAG TPA: DUF732 domain-containing protein [Acidimicrobiia bacterium]|nr:DUF732 domain-containing protein [Acidimicrobiia bacterium]